MSGSGRKRLLALLRPAVAVVILVLVGRTLPWSDQLAWTPPSGEPVTLSGEIEGDWKSDEVRFRLDPEEPGWPPALAERRAPDGAVPLERGAFAGGEVDWKPGMPRAFREIDPGGLALAFALFALALVFGVTRWWRLLAVAGCRTRWMDSLRLTFLGLFFNIVVPGLTGGDVIKAVLATRENPGKRAEALVSVVVDRVIGLLVLTALAATVILVRGGALAELRTPVLVFLGIALAGAFAYVNRGLRRALGFERLLARLPLGDKLKLVDDAVLIYSRQPREGLWAVLLSVGNHVFNIGGIAALGIAFGVSRAQVGIVDYMALVPVAHIVSSVPIAPGGWGVGELAFRHLFELVGASATLGVAVSVTFRLCQMTLGLLGGLFLLAPGGRVDLSQIEREAAEAGGSPGGSPAT